MANYFDNSHINGKQLTPQQIADAIRHKKFGVDVREAIAQGFEQFIGRLNDDETEIHDLQGDVKALNQRCDKIEEKHTDDIEAINQRLTKLEKAVFGYGEYEVNYETPPQTIDHVSEINTDSNPKLKGE